MNAHAKQLLYIADRLLTTAEAEDCEANQTRTIHTNTTRLLAGMTRARTQMELQVYIRR